MTRHILTAFVFLLSAISAFADEITASDITLNNDVAQSLDISLSNTATDIMGLQFSLKLPNGVVPVMEDGKVTITPSDRLAGSFTLRGGKMADGSYLFTLLSNDRSVIAANEGALFSISLGNTTATDGNYTALLSDVVATDINGDELSVSGSSFNIKVEHKYNLTYYVDGEEYQSYIYTVGDAITPITQPTKVGHTFSGWSEVPDSMPANDVIVTGSFTINSYKLAYVVDGVTIDSAMVDYGASITPKEFPSKIGYTFSGWSELPDSMPANNLIITGSYTINQYKLAYVIDGVTVDSLMLDYKTAIGLREEPSREGYTFSGWSEVPDSMPSNDVIVTGSFTINSYKLAYVVDGVTIDSAMVDYGASITPKEFPSKIGYTFSGWSEMPDSMPANNLIITGSYTINQYKLAYVIDGVTVDSLMLDYKAAIAFREEPSREGYTFSGWSEVPDSMPANDVTVTGSFNINQYKLTYMVDGVAMDSVMVDYGTIITPKEAPSKTGYTFNGWSEIPGTMPANDVIVDGSFSVNYYKATYYVNEEFYAEDSLSYGSFITPASKPTKEGHTFHGWSEIPETMPAYDLTITGFYTTNQYKLAYVVDGVTVDSIMVDYGAIITPKDDLSKNGFTFSGWSAVPDTMPAHDVIVSGSFAINYLIPTDEGELTVNDPDGTLELRLQNAPDIKTLWVNGKVTDEDIKTIESLDSLLAIFWNANRPMPSAIKDYGNTNLMVYVNDSSYIDNQLKSMPNVIVNGTAEKVQLTDGEPLLIPEEFHAVTAFFTRKFTMETVRGVSAGWNSLVLPFEVQTTLHQYRGVITPFGTDEELSDLHYWLMGCDNGFVQSMSVLANEPYIISMPNSPDYIDYYNITGKIGFTSENVTIHSTKDATPSEVSGFTFVPAYEPVEQSDTCTLSTWSQCSLTAQNTSLAAYSFVTHATSIHSSAISFQPHTMLVCATSFLWAR